MRIKVGDFVQVIAGDDKGQRGKVLAVQRDSNTVTVEGLCKVFKHVKRSQKNPQGGRLSKEMPLNASNVMIVCPQSGRPSKVKYQINAEGKKVRVFKSGLEV